MTWSHYCLDVGSENKGRAKGYLSASDLNEWVNRSLILWDWGHRPSFPHEQQRQVGYLGGAHVWECKALRKPKGLGGDESEPSKREEIKSNTRWVKEADESHCKQSAFKNSIGVEGVAKNVLTSARRFLKIYWQKLGNESGPCTQQDIT